MNNQKRVCFGRPFKMALPLLAIPFGVYAKVAVELPFERMASVQISHTQAWVENCQANYKVMLQKKYPSTWLAHFNRKKVAFCTEYNVTFKATVNNSNGVPALDVKGDVFSRSSNITVTQAHVDFGNLLAHSRIAIDSAFQIIANGLTDTSTPRVYMKLSYKRNLLFPIASFPVNTWVKVSSIKTPWVRQSHGTMVVDRQTGNLLLFGAETHSLSGLDNTVREFNINTLSWTEHYPISSFDSYQLDAQGQAIADSLDEPKPWAMHAYDEVVYDPKAHGLVVVAYDPHNYPAFQKFPNAIHPTWLYDLNSHAWKTVVNHGSSNPLVVPNFFAAASEFDATRNVIWALRRPTSIVEERQGGLWLLNAKRDTWTKVANPAGGIPYFEISINMVRDTLRDKLVVFGNYVRQNSKILAYSPNASDPTAVGSWEVRDPGGDIITPDDQIPASYDEKQGIFLLLPSQGTTETSADTVVYDPVKNIYIKIPDAGTILNADLNPLNFMLQYNPKTKMFFLITGRWNTETAVWAFKLDYSKLSQPL